MAVRRTSESTDTRSAILDSAERLVQSRGFNGFSYADIAAELHVTKAALHYHFPTKSELGDALVGRYTSRFHEALVDIDAQQAPAPLKLRAYADLYLGVLRNDRMCLCGMLAAEYQTLSGPMRQSVNDFFDENHTWLARLLESGRAARTLRYAGTAPEAAQMIVGALEGAMLVARSYGDPARFEAMSTRLIAEFTPSEPRRRRG